MVCIALAHGQNSVVFGGYEAVVKLATESSMVLGVMRLEEESPLVIGELDLHRLHVRHAQYWARVWFYTDPAPVDEMRALVSSLLDELTDSDTRPSTFQCFYVVNDPHTKRRRMIGHERIIE